MAVSVYAGKMETGASTLLSDVECKTLIKQAQDGNKAARDRLIECNLRLVASFVHRFAGRGEEQDDLFQIGIIGLLKAIHHFDLSYEVCFSTYAVPVIMGEMRRYLRDNSSVRVSRSMKELAYKALQAKENFIKEHQTEPTIEQLAGMLEKKKEDVLFALEAVMPPVSIYEPIGQDKDGAEMILLEKLGDEKSSDQAWLEKINLEQCLTLLTPKEQWVFQKRYQTGLTQQEIAAELNLSQAQISRLEKKALEKIRKFYQAEEP